MKLKLRTRILSACLILSFLVTACGGTAENTDTETVNVEREYTEIVGSPAESEEIGTETVAEITEEAIAESAETEAEVVEEETAVTEITAEEAEWQNSVMPDVNDSLNVRAEANQESEIVGKLAKGDKATVVEIGEEWTKITSGNVEGYIKNSYCIYGTEALEYAKKNCDTVATTTGSSLRIRAGMSTDSKIIKTIEKDKKLIVDTSAESNDEWVAVRYGSNTYYVSAEYVSVELVTGTGLTTEEIAEIEQKKAAEKAAAEKALAEARAKAQNNVVALSNVDDYTLLAAIISCEAGSESYETQLAVGSVIMNRVRSGRWGGSLAEVLTRPGQFPPATNGILTNKLTSGRISSTSYEAASAALAGYDNTYGCLHFNRNNGARSGIVYGRLVFW